MVSAHPILVVEDEFLIALDIVAALEQSGIVVAGPLEILLAEAGEDGHAEHGGRIVTAGRVV